MTIAKDIMSQMILVASHETTVEEAVKLLVNNRITGLPVVNDKGTCVGVLSEYDIINHLGCNEDFSDQQLKSLIKYTDSVESIDEETPLNEIIDIFTRKKVRRLPVLDKKKKPVGMVTRRDIMRLVYYRAKVKVDG